MNILFQRRMYIARVLVTRSSMGLARYGGRYNTHQFKGTTGIHPKFFDRQGDRRVFLFEYTSASDAGGNAYDTIQFEQGTGRREPITILKTIWGLSLYRVLTPEDTELQSSVQTDTVQTLKRIYTWRFLEPVHVQKIPTRGRWLSMRNRTTEMTQLVEQTTLASDNRVQLIPETMVEIMDALPGLQDYTFTNRTGSVEICGILPGMHV
jgi:hypothetical protein